MDTVYVQVTSAESDRPVHALAVLVDEDEDAGPEPYVLDTRTVCERLGADTMERPYPPFQPFANTPTEQRCAPCDFALAQRRAGMPTGIARFQ